MGTKKADVQGHSSPDKAELEMLRWLEKVLEIQWKDFGGQE